jgi:hypothetical protein
LADARGGLVAVVIVKATFEFDSSLTLTESSVQDEVLYRDLSDPGTDSGDIRIPSDLADHKPATDVLIIRPPGPVSKTRLYGRDIRLALGPVNVHHKIGSNWPLGPARRDAKARRNFAGTYDKQWLEGRMPLLPEDFDYRYHLAAPADQTVPGYCRGDETMHLDNLFGEGRISLRLPGRALIVSGEVLGDYFARPAVLDTICVFADQPRLILVWRLTIPLRRKFEEVGDLVTYTVGLRTAQELFATGES